MNLRSPARITLLAIFTLSFILLVQFSATSKAMDKQHVDIIGIKLGMSQDQVVSALKAHNKDVRVTFEKFEIIKPDPLDPMSAWRASAQASNLGRTGMLLFPNYLKAIHASLSGINSESVTIIFSVPPATNVVRNIKRTNRFSQSMMPSKDNVIGALKQKYGTPTHQGKQVLAWNYSENDNIELKQKCLAAIEYSVVERDALDIPSNAGCGLVLTVKIQGDDLVSSGLSAALVDYSEVERQKIATEDYRIQLLKKSDEQRKQKADKNLPTL